MRRSGRTSPAGERFARADSGNEPEKTIWKPFFSQENDGFPLIFASFLSFSHLEHHGFCLGKLGFSRELVLLKVLFLLLVPIWRLQAPFAKLFPDRFPFDDLFLLKFLEMAMGQKDAKPNGDHRSGRVYFPFHLFGVFWGTWYFWPIAIVCLPLVLFQECSFWFGDHLFAGSTSTQRWVFYILDGGHWHKPLNKKPKWQKLKAEKTAKSYKSLLNHQTLAALWAQALLKPSEERVSRSTSTRR